MLVSFAEFVKRPRTLWVAFGSVVILSVGFQLARPLVGGVLLDEVSDGATVLSMLSGMSTEQLVGHIAVTVGLDFLYPLAYAALFAGLIIRGFNQYSPALLLSLVILLIADLVENLSQIALLAMVLLQFDNASLAALAWLKGVATSSKFSMLYLTVAIVVLALLRLAVQKILALRKPNRLNNTGNDG